MHQLRPSRASWLLPVLLTACNTILGNEPRILDVDSAAPASGTPEKDVSAPEDDASLDSSLDASDTADATASGDATISADAPISTDAPAASDVAAVDAASPLDATADVSPPPCPNGNGLYCGGDLVGGDPSTLYFCTDSGLIAQSPAPCPHGCYVVHGKLNDYCAVDCTGKSVGGSYCGGDGIGGSLNVLYQCGSGGSGTIQSYCPNGCSIQPPGTDDKCN